MLSGLIHHSQRRLWLLVIIGLLVATSLACLEEETPPQSGQSQTQEPAANNEPAAETSAVSPTSPSAQPADRPAGQGEAEWTIMLYQDADDEVLEQDIMTDFNEAERVGSTDQVNIVAQVDRYKGAFKGMGNWTTTKRFYITQDNNLKKIGSQEIEDLGEVNMADGQTLVDFITWVVKNYPARKYALIMSDHGAGWPGGWTDPDPGGLGPDRVAVAELFGVDGLWLMEIDKALEEARTQTGIEKFDLVGFDACLMGQLEVFSMLEPHARYAVASQEVEPALGWAYAGFLTQLVKKPGMDGAELSKYIVKSYIDQDLRIVDDESRRQLLIDEFGYNEDVSPAEVAEAKSRDVTLTAVDLSAIPAINTAVDNLAAALVSVKSKKVAQARAYAQSFESIFGEGPPSPYIDLGHFLQLVVKQSKNKQVTAAATEVYEALKQAILAEKHGPDRSGATGITIYFPTSEIFNAADNVGYTTVARRFADESKWDDFLTAFHTGGGANFNRPKPSPTAAAPQLPPGLSKEDLAIIKKDIAYLKDLGYTLEEIPQILIDQGGYPPELVEALAEAGFFKAAGSKALSRSVLAVGPKPVELAPLTLSAELAAPDKPVTISSEVSGDRLAYLYTFIGRILPRQNVLLIEDKDYIFADDTQEINKVKYPVWPEGGFKASFDWEPTVYAVNDGKTSVKALFDPVAYDPDTPTYSVSGIYRFASGGEPRFAKINFRDNKMTDIFGFTSGITQAVGAPRQILPQSGDQFTILERGDDLSKEGQAGREAYTHEGGTLTFSGQPFTLETTPAPSGNYVIGMIAEDLDGNTYEQYEGLFVVNDQASAVDGFKPYVNEELGFALLHPEKWEAQADQATDSVDFSDPNGSAVTTISRNSYPEATDAAAANSQAIQEVIDTLSQQRDLKNLQFVTDVTDYWLGSFEAKTVDFSFDLDGQPYYGYAVASTPVEGTTYVVLVSSLDADFDKLSPDFDDMLYSFDILISGVSKEQVGPPAPELVSETFSDDFSNPASGLIDEPTEQEWGSGYYGETGQYIFELKPAPGAIYDYYAEQELPDEFLMQATGSYAGAVDNAYGLIFRVQAGEEQDEFYTFRISGDGFYSVEKTEGNELKTVIDWTASSLIKQEEGAGNELMVEGKGETYRLYINGRQVDSFTDETFKGGTFGLMVDNYDEANPANFTFTDLKVGTAKK